MDVPGAFCFVKRDFKAFHADLCHIAKPREGVELRYFLNTGHFVES